MPGLPGRRLRQGHLQLLTDCVPPGGGRDLLIRSPGVTWTDIAGLEEPKRVLQENVILPLLMPDYFQGIRRPVKASATSHASQL